MSRRRIGKSSVGDVTDVEAHVYACAIVGADATSRSCCAARCAGRIANGPTRCRRSIRFAHSDGRSGSGRGGGDRSVHVVGGDAAFVSGRRARRCVATKWSPSIMGRSACGGLRRGATNLDPARDASERRAAFQIDTIARRASRPWAKKGSGSSRRGGRWCADAARWGR